MSKIKRLLVFDLKGNIAHFRKFYTSSSSLTYTFPPRTTITGLIAAILGKERDTYYEEFGSQNCRVAISLRKPVKKIMQTINYIRTKGSDDGFSSFSGVVKRFIEKGITKYPTPLELVISTQPSKEIIYRIYFWHVDQRVMDEVCLRTKEKKSVYPLYLGLSEFLADIEFIEDIPSQMIKECSSSQAVQIATVCNVEHLEKEGLEFTDIHGSLEYIKERMPLEFGDNREIKQKTNFIYERNQRGINARLKIPYLQVTYSNKKQENILFMEQEK